MHSINTCCINSLPQAWFRQSAARPKLSWIFCKFLHLASKSLTIRVRTLLRVCLPPRSTPGCSVPLTFPVSVTIAGA